MGQAPEIIRTLAHGLADIFGKQKIKWGGEDVDRVMNSSGDEHERHPGNHQVSQIKHPLWKFESFNLHHEQDGQASMPRKEKIPSHIVRNEDAGNVRLSPYDIFRKGELKDCLNIGAVTSIPALRA